MKRIGLLGGMSWESSLEYYRLVNEGVRARLGGLHSADLLLRSVDFAAVATQAVPDGALVHVDGGTGEVRVLRD